jgi:hypothetical protein
MDSSALHFRSMKKACITEFGFNQNYSDQVILWTSLLSMKINKGQKLKNHEGQSTKSCALHFFSIRSIIL